MIKTIQPTHLKKPARLATVASSLALLTTACAEETEVVVPEDETAEIALAADRDWIRLDGEVVSSTPGSPASFVLDYGAGNITVEADDWDWATDGIALVPGDIVSVSGRVDEGLFSTETIEAGAIYVRNLNTVFYANPADEEQLGLAAAPLRPVTDGVDYTGWVTGKSADSFTLGAGPMKITVNTDDLDTSYITSGVEAGDRVYVWGDLTLSSGGDSQLDAEGLLELRDGSKKQGKVGTSAAETASGEPPVDGVAPEANASS